MSDINRTKIRLPQKAVKAFFAAASVITVLLVCAYLCYHSISVFDTVYMTGIVKNGRAEERLELEGAVFRDDYLIVSSDGEIKYLRLNGERVGKDTETARVYTDMSADGNDNTAIAEKMRELESRIEYLNECLDVGHATYYTASVAAKSAYTDLLSYMARAGGKPKDAMDAYGRLSLELNKFNVVRNGKTGREEITKAIDTLKAEYDRLSESYHGSFVSVIADKSGWFFDKAAVDGYESIFTTGALKSVNAASLRNMMQSEPAQVPVGTIGKMTYTYSWYLAVPADTATCRRLEPGREYKITFEDGRELSLTLERVAAVMNGEGVLVFRCDIMPDNFDYKRVQKISLTVEEYEGYSVPASAVHTVDGVTGIYVLSGGKLSFRRADILSEQNGVCIIAKEPPKAPEAETETGTGTEAPDGTNGPETSSDTIADTAGVTSAETGDDGPGYPKLNDIIIISGDGLYDGKVIG
ncbi:MAG: hypothetical protein MR471_00590 [Clostridia bacterium]|nr:hypothetical protein [Clostridia bacterium]